MDITLCISASLLLHVINVVESAYPVDDYYWPSICPYGIILKNCDPNPCHVHKCTNKKAICEPNHCGACSVDFFDERGHLITFEECFMPDENWSPRSLSRRIIAETATCAAHPNALRVHGEFFKYGRRLLPHECSLNNIPEKCEDGSKPCKEDLCRHATCNSTSETVICVPDYCKCSAYFVNQDNERITCGKSTFQHKDFECPTHVKKRAPVYCLTDTCKRICRGYPEAICVHECGSCAPTYYDRKGNKLGRDKCP